MNQFWDLSGAMVLKWLKHKSGCANESKENSYPNPGIKNSSGIQMYHIDWLYE